MHNLAPTDLYAIQSIDTVLDMSTTLGMYLLTGFGRTHAHANMHVRICTHAHNYTCILTDKDALMVIIMIIITLIKGEA